MKTYKNTPVSVVVSDTESKELDQYNRDETINLPISPLFDFRQRRKQSRKDKYSKLQTQDYLSSPIEIEAKN
jgi:hypothetical protein